MYRSTLLTSVTAIALLGACSNTNAIKQSEQTTSTGSNFAKAMHREYIDLAKSQDAQGDHKAAEHYLTKARLAASGKEVGPDDPKRRDIAGPEEAPINAGYKKLRAALASGAAEREPTEAAKAQAKFDCWVEQSEEGYQPVDIQVCRTGFQTALAALGDTATSAEKVQQTIAEKAPPSGSPFTVNFKFDSVALTDTSQAEMATILEKVSIYKPKIITITAHTDLVGSQKYNNVLSARRASDLGSKVEAAGAASVIATGVGEMDPVEQTQKASMANRRAVISFD